MDNSGKNGRNRKISIRRPSKEQPSASLLTSSGSLVEGMFLPSQDIDFINSNFTNNEEESDEKIISVVNPTPVETPALLLLRPDLQETEARKLADTTTNTESAFLLRRKKADFSLLKASKRLDSFKVCISPRKILVNDFPQNFHELSFVEKKRNLSIYLHRNWSYLKANPDAVNLLSSTLTGKTYGDNLLHLDFLLKLQKTPELLDIFLAGNPIFTSKILKDPRFVHFLTETDPGKLVGELLPKLSFATRLKTLWKIQNAPNFDDIFDKLQAQYGVFFARKFISGCSAAKIQQISENYPLKLTAQQFTILTLKNPARSQFYFGFIDQNQIKFLGKPVLKAIFVQSLELFSKITRGCYFLNVNFGGKTTRAFVKTHKAAVLTNPKNYVKLKTGALVRALGSDARVFFENSLPYNFEDISELEALVALFPKQHQYELYFTVTEQFYKRKFSENPAGITQAVLGVIPDNSKRAFYAQIAVNTGREQYFKYLLPQDAIRLIKKKINITSDSFLRSNLIINLVETCAINKDLNALKGVIKYYNIRHKNEEVHVHTNFVKSIFKNCKVAEFTEDIWNDLNKLYVIYTTKCPESPKRKLKNWPFAVHKLHYMAFLFKTGVSIDELLQDYFTVCTQFPKWGSFEPAFEKKVLDFSVTFADEPEEAIKCKVINAIFGWNKTYKNAVISLYDFPHLATAFEEILRSSPTIPKEILVYFREKVLAEKPARKFLGIYFERFATFGRREDLLWFLKFDRSTILEFLPKILDLKLGTFWWEVKKHEDIKTEILRISVGRVLNDAALECLSIIMDAEKYINFVNKSAPEGLVVFSYKNIKDVAVWEALLQQSGSKFGVSSLNCLFYHIPGALFGLKLNVLKSHSPRLHRQATRILFQQAPIPEIENFITLELENPEIFTSVLKFFIKNPQNQLFQLMKRLKSNKSLEHLIVDKIDDIPSSYKAQYIEFFWSFLQGHDWKTEEALKSTMIRHCSAKICAGMSLDFGINVINSHFWTQKPLYLHEFIFNFISSQGLIFPTIFTILRRQTNEERINFFDFIYTRSIKKKSNLRFLGPFVDFYGENLRVIEDFKQFVRLFFLKIAIEGVHDNLKELASRFVQFLRYISSNLGKAAVSKFAEGLKEALPNLLTMQSQESSLFLICYQMIKDFPDVDVATLILDIIHQPPYSSPSIEDFWKILAELRKFQDKSIQFILSQKFNT